MTDRDPVINDPTARARSHSNGAAPQGGFAPLVPELGVTDIRASLAFWCGILGFTVGYDRPAARFAYLTLGRVHVMLCELNGRWDSGAPERPVGRGLNLQVTVDDLAPMLGTLEWAGWPLFEAPEVVWYRVGAMKKGQREFLVQDPDGYLLRFVQDLGMRPAEDEAP